MPWVVFLLDHLDEFNRHKLENGKLIQDNWKKLSAAFKSALGWEPIQPEGSMYGNFSHNCESDLKAAQKALEAGVGVCPSSMFFANSPSNTHLIRIHCGISTEKAQEIVSKLSKTQNDTLPK